jgi:hypothetical protein
MALMTWAKANERRLPELALLCHIPNGGLRSIREAGRFKRMGVRPGYPDYVLDVPRGVFHGLRIELKAEGGKVSAVQKEWLAALNKQGYCAVVAVGWTAASNMIEAYLKKV